MAIADFGSLHAGMMERRSTKGDYDGGKVVKTLVSVPVTQPKIELRRERLNTPPIRSLLDKVADWTELPAQRENTFAKRPEGRQSPAPVSNNPVSNNSVPNNPVSNDVVAEHSVSGQVHSGHVSPEPTVSGEATFVFNAPTERQAFGEPEVTGRGQKKPPRKALTLRLDYESHRRLRLASAGLGRSCQDLLYNAMASYLVTLGFNEPSKGSD